MVIWIVLAGLVVVGLTAVGVVIVRAYQIFTDEELGITETQETYDREREIDRARGSDREWYYP